jgi:hypothetical protein
MHYVHVVLEFELGVQLAHDYMLRLRQKNENLSDHDMADN